MSVQPQTEQHQEQNDVFTVELPWGLPKDSPFVINELEFPIVQLQQLIIEDLESKLEAKAAPRNQKMAELYDAMKADRDDILLQRDRAKAETDVMRRDRNRFMEENKRLDAENDDLFDAKTELEEKLAKTQTELRHALDELAGVPKRIENSVKAALAEKSGGTREQVAEYEQKLQERRDTNSRLNVELTEERNKNRELEELVTRQSEVCKGIELAYDNAEAKWTGIMKHISDVNGYAAMLTHENEMLKNDNLLHALMLEYEQLKTVYQKDDWKTIVFCAPQQLNAESGDDEPSRDYAICFCVSELKGCGHFVYINENNKLTFPKETPVEMRIPEEHHAELEASMLKADLKHFNGLVDRSAARARNIIHYARLLDVDWSKAPKLVEVCQQLEKHLPESDVKTLSEAITRGRALIPKTNRKIQEINERYGTEFEPIDTKKTRDLDMQIGMARGQVPVNRGSNNKKKRKKRK